MLPQYYCTDLKSMASIWPLFVMGCLTDNPLHFSGLSVFRQLTRLFPINDSQDTIWFAERNDSIATVITLGECNSAVIG
jgi:hypothetical protein